MKVDVVVLGAGIVGVSIALHLQARGRSVALLDRRGAGEETSYGNAGLIERSSVIPYAFPRSLTELVRVGLKLTTTVNFHWRFLPQVAPWLFEYWRNSSPTLLAEAAAAMLPLIERSVTEHVALMKSASAENLARDTGWIAVYRKPRDFDDAVALAESLKDYNLKYDVLDAAQLSAREPFVSGVHGAIHWLDPVTVMDPGGLTKAYADLFVRRGGQFVKGDARSLRESDGHWTVTAEGGLLTARDAVLSLGPWSSDVFRALGYRYPLAIKRGYHRHYRAESNAVLNHPVLDRAAGYVLAPMAQGIRLTSGAEFAARDALPTPVQIARDEPLARSLFPLGEPVEAQPWVGNRPCFPDMRPIIGRAPKHRGLWFAFGHAHHGFTLGPVTGRLMAEMMTGGETCVDPAPYRAERFRG